MLLQGGPLPQNLDSRVLQQLDHGGGCTDVEGVVEVAQPPQDLRGGLVVEHEATLEASRLRGNDLRIRGHLLLDFEERLHQSGSCDHLVRTASVRRCHGPGLSAHTTNKPVGGNALLVSVLHDIVLPGIELVRQEVPLAVLGEELEGAVLRANAVCAEDDLLACQAADLTEPLLHTQPRFPIAVDSGCCHACPRLKCHSGALLC